MNNTTTYSVLIANLIMYRIVWLTVVFMTLSVFTNAQHKTMKMEDRNFEVVTLGGGCFWCVEAIYLRLNGVVKIESGYSGGKTSNPTYREVCSGLTGHAEVVQVTYDPQVVSLAQILEVFFKTHNPTTLNRQGADVGTQYRSAIFYINENQKRVAEEVMQMLSDARFWKDPIVTEITPFVSFFKAEDSHQNYFANNKKQVYCQMVIIPKVEKFEKLFKDYLKK